MNTRFRVGTKRNGIIRQRPFHSLPAARRSIRTGGRGEGWGTLYRASWGGGERTPLGLITDCNRVDELEGGIDAVLDALEAA